LSDEDTTPVTLMFASTPLFFAFSLHSQVVSARTAMQEISGVPVVQVSVNGTGPYPFVLDTGANVTVMTKELLHLLNIRSSGSVTIAAALGDTDQERAEAATLDVAGLTVEHLEVNTLESGRLGMLSGAVQGILGENFLKHFDVLIDNEHHQLILDRSTDLSNSIAGEHLPFVRTGIYHSESTVDRIVIPLQLTLLTRRLFFLLDSGTNTVVLFPAEQSATGLVWGSGHGDVESFSRTQTCHVTRTAAVIASKVFHGIMLAACDKRTRDTTDSDGLLPTRIFHRLFISHQQGYVIANPKQLRHACRRYQTPRGEGEKHGPVVFGGVQ
jgi:gag-polyprotein putative aspartyl protease